MRFIIPIFFFVFLVARPVFAQPILNCQPSANVPIEVTPIFEEPHYDFSQNLAAMQMLASDHEHSIPQYHEIAMGLTRYQPMLEMSMPLMVETTSDGHACAHIERVNVRVGYRDVTVFVASEIPQNSCGFTETLRHEGKHVAVNREVLEEFVPQIREALAAYIEQNSTFRPHDANDAQKTIHETLKSIVATIIGKMRQENDRRQKQVDSPEEYARLAHVCNGQLTYIASQYRRYGH